MVIWLMSVIFSIIFVILGENDLMANGIMHDNSVTEFTVTMLMEIVTIGAIPLALRLFKFRKIHNNLTSDQTENHQQLLLYGVLRIDMLHIPMIFNTVFYYLYMNVAFGYMAIILFLAGMFIFPTMKRCLLDVETPV